MVGEGMKNLPSDYFLDADDDILDFLEKQGEECIREIHCSNSINKENGYKLLSILIVGIGSSFLLLTQKTHLDFLGAGLAVFVFYWSICAVYLVVNVLKVHKRAIIHASPDILYTPAIKGITAMDYARLKERGFSGKDSRLSILRRYRLMALCRTANELLQENKRLREGLEKARISAILAPVYSLMVSVVIYFFF